MQNKFRKYGVNKIVYSFLIAIYSEPRYMVPGHSERGDRK